MTKEEIVDFLKFEREATINLVNTCKANQTDYFKKRIEANNMAIKVLEQETCEDTISRQAVLDTLDKMDKALDIDRTVENYKELLTECYKDLASAVSKEKTAKWETTTTVFCGRTFEVIECSCCKQKQEYFAKTKFCPNCGAKMIET